MKGSVFQGNLQFHLEVQGESWVPGQMLKGNLSVSNQGTSSVPLNDIGVILAHADFKKVKASDPKAFQAITTQTFPAQTVVEAKSTQTLPWAIQLAETAPVNDKASSLYLVFGNLADKTKGGHLQMTVTPRPLIMEFLRLFENFFRFKVKEIRQKKDCLSIKFIPPTSREYATTEGFSMLIKHEAENLHLTYLFSIKKIGYTQGETAMQKDEIVFEKVLGKKEYQMGPDMIDQDKILAHIGDILSQVKMKANY